MAEIKLESIDSWQTESKKVGPSLLELSKWLSSDELIQWLETLLKLQTAAIVNNDFYQQTANSMAQLVGLDEATVILKQQGQWQVVAHSQRSGQLGEVVVNADVVRKVEQERATFFQVGSEYVGQPNLGETFYVASPIFDSTGTVAGALFGTRRNEEDTQNGFCRLDALVVQLLAGIVSSGLARQIRQEEADRFRMQLEQFASAKLVTEMGKDPTFLESREREITVLFGDVRGFTGLAQRVGPEKTFSMIRNLMDQLTGCILDEEGFIIDYAGDGIAAMWNAPADQPDHAELACWAAVSMQKVMDKLSEFWSFVAGESLLAGIGINTGIAHVGNSGSRWRLKYSPLGAAVNLASRLEGANKYFGSSILVSEESRRRMFTSFPLRRIGPVIVKGSLEPVQVFQVLTEPEQVDHTHVIAERYQMALEYFEHANYKSAIECLEQLLADDDDEIARRLLDQSVDLLATPLSPPAIRLVEK